MQEFEQVVRIEADCRDPERLIFHQEIMQSVRGCHPHGSTTKHKVIVV